MLRKNRHRETAVFWPLVVLFICFAREGHCQTFSSGSTGADGALNLTTPGTIIFDPVALGLHPIVENVFNFTTINIAAGVTVTLSNKVLTGPVYWLAQGSVTISGTVDLSGEDGHPATTNASIRVPAAGGAGGYSGGVGGIQTGIGLPAAQAGNGPGGGAAPTGTQTTGTNGQFTGSQYLIPLIGGSGGSGAASNQTSAFGAGGGGGGGAILIASSVSITINNGGSIRSRGGTGGSQGSGGAIRLVAPLLASNVDRVELISVSGGVGGIPGLLRLEAFQFTFSLITNSPFIVSTPNSILIPATAPSSIKVTSINGVPINCNPCTFPAATINSSVPVTVNVQAQYIPIGTIPRIIVMSETGPDQNVNCAAPLTGTLQQSTCSASIVFPTGGSRGFVKAIWTQ